ncbi:hypothetical protein HY024_01240 [Candidatus Curtissbacteria bacterium]|nr:hypothetical protein [Candidatus Curtissbacteria bacterium]
MEAGLKARRSLASEVFGILQTHRPSSGKGDFVGTCALKRSDLDAAERKKSAWALHPDLKNFDELVRDYRLRKAILPQIAQGVIGFLPGELFPDASIESFPKEEEMAGIVRNSMVSAACNGYPMPALSVEDVRVAIAQNEYHALSRDQIVLQYGEILNAVAEASGISKTEVIEYLEALQAQTDQLITNYSPQYSDDVAAGKLHTFMAFKGVLLLMHPLLEEKELIVNKDRAYESDYSIWGPEHSVVIGNYRIPNFDILAKADATARAKGVDPSKFRTALYAWKQKDKNVKVNAASVERWQQKVEKAQTDVDGFVPERVKTFDEGILVPLSRKYPMEVKDFRDKRKAWQVVVRNFKSVGRTLARINELKKIMAVDSETFALPSWKMEQRRRVMEQQKESAGTKYSEALLAFSNHSYDDLVHLATYQGKNFMRRLDGMGIDNLDKLISQWAVGERAVFSNQDALHRVGDITAGDIITFTDSRIKSYQDLIADFDKETKGLPETERVKQIRAGVRIRLAQNLATQRNLRRNLAPFEFSRHKKGVPGFYLLWSLQSRVDLLGAVLGTKLSLEEITHVEGTSGFSREGVEYLLKKYESSVLFLKTTGSTATDDNVRSLHETQGILSQSLSWVIGQGSLPLIIPDKEELASVFDERIEFYGKSREKSVKVAEVTRINRYIASLIALRRNLGNPLMPFPECVGLSSDDFRVALNARSAHIHYQLRAKELRTDYDKAFDFISTAAGELKLDSLKRNLQRAKKQLGVMEQRTFDNELLERMQELGLALPL